MFSIQWLVNVGAARLASLSLGAISLDVQRRRIDSDVLEMAKHFKPQDVLCCEVQKTQASAKPQKPSTSKPLYTPNPAGSQVGAVLS